MLTVRDLMTEELVTVTPADTIREAAEAMAEAHVSGLPAVEGGKAVGVISATDVMTFAAETSGVELPRHRHPAPELVPAGDQWEEDAELPSRFFLDDWEDARYAFEEFFPSTERPEWNVMEEYTVGELMTRSVLSIAPDAPIEEAVRGMLDAGVRRLLVLDEGDPVGVISSTDVMEAVAERGIRG